MILLEYTKALLLNLLQEGISFSLYTTTNVFFFSSPPYLLFRREKRHIVSKAFFLIERLSIRESLWFLNSIKSLLLFVSLIRRPSPLIPVAHAQMTTIVFLEVATVEYAKTPMWESHAILMKIVL